MENVFLGFFTGGSLILAIGPQNLFVIEQGLKRNYILLVTTLCALSVSRMGRKYNRLVMR